MALNGVTSFIRWKDVTYTCKYMRHNPTIGGTVSSAMAESWKKLNTVNIFLSFIVCKNLKALFRELLNNNLLFVGQLYEDKSLVLCAHDLIFFTTDLQTLNYLELIFFHYGKLL